MANEGSTKPTYSELEAENLRVRGLLQRQWVSVEERLPEKHATYVLVICHGGIVRGAEFDWGFDSKPVWAWPHGFGSYSQVTHWMPLPAPPTFPQSSSPVPEGAESADIGKLDTADKSGAALSAAEEINKVNRARGHVLKSEHHAETVDVMPTEEMARIIQRHWLAGSAETGGEKA